MWHIKSWGRVSVIFHSNKTFLLSVSCTKSLALSSLHNLSFKPFSGLQEDGLHVNYKVKVENINDFIEPRNQKIYPPSDFIFKSLIFGNSRYIDL